MNKTTTIDITPRWGDIIHFMMDTLENPDAKRESKDIYRKEIARLAECADNINDKNKETRQ